MIAVSSKLSLLSNLKEKKFEKKKSFGFGEGREESGGRHKFEDLLRKSHGSENLKIKIKIFVKNCQSYNKNSSFLKMTIIIIN